MCFLFLFKAFQALTQQTLLTSALVTVISESKGGKVEINGKTPSWQTVPILGGAGQRAQTARGARGRAASSCYNAGIKRERCTTAERLYPFLHGPCSLATATVEKELWNCRAGMTARLRWVPGHIDAKGHRLSNSLAAALCCAFVFFRFLQWAGS